MQSLHQRFPVPQGLSTQLTTPIFVGNTASFSEIRPIQFLAHYEEQASRHQLNIPYHEEVERLARSYYQQGVAAHTLLLTMSDQYFPMIEEELQKAGLPKELKYLPAALSALNPQAESHLGAGLWQINYFLARKLGLEVNDYIDQRFDPLLSTRAAIHHLKDLKAQFGNWESAVIAYACGPAGLRRAQGRQDSNDIWDLYANLPEMGREVIPAFAAVRYWLNREAQFTFQRLPLSSLPQGDRIYPSREISCDLLCQALRVPKEELIAYNPLLRSNTLPGQGSHCPAYVPPGYGAKFAQIEDSLEQIEAEIQAEKARQAEIARIEAEKAKIPAGHVEISYTIQSGDNLGLIASRYHVGVSQLKAWNNLPSDRITAGKSLIVYVPQSKAGQDKDEIDNSLSQKQGSAGEKNSPQSKEEVQTPKGDYKVYTVKSGDNLWTIAQKYPGVSDADIRKWNGIGNDLQPGQKLKIYTGN